MTDHVERNREVSWGIWGLPERETGALPAVAGLDVIELGCGTAYWSAWLMRRGRARGRAGQLLAPARHRARAASWCSSRTACSSPCAPAGEGTADAQLKRDYFGIYRLEWLDVSSIEFTLPVGGWVRLFRAHGLEILDFIELRAPADGSTSCPYVTAAWAHRWLSEEIWRVRKR